MKPRPIKTSASSYISSAANPENVPHTAYKWIGGWRFHKRFLRCARNNRGQCGLRYTRFARYKARNDEERDVKFHPLFLHYKN